MSIKKKLGLGVASGALGLAMIGGGTWAAFNDVENLDNNFTAGTLNLGLTPGDTGVANFDIQNLKPGDEMVRTFRLSNTGSLSIQHVWMDITDLDFENGQNEFVNVHKQLDNDLDDSGLDFLDQFKVEILRTGTEAGPLPAPFTIISSTDDVTLKDLVTGDIPNTGGEFETDSNGKVTRINLAPTNTSQPTYNGLPANPRDYEEVEFKISMINNPARVTDSSSPAYREFVQNKYQGDSISFNLEFEATQWNGIQHKTNGDGAENAKANPGPAVQTTP